jgi:hypothetical protein
MSGTQVSSFYPVNQLLVDNAQQISNQYAPQRNELFIQKTQQEIGSNEIEYAARAAQGLLGLGDEAAMAAAYPGAVAEAQRYGFLKNAPSVFPGKERLQQIATMGVSAEKQYEQQGVAGDYQTWLRNRGAVNTGQPATGATVAPGAAAPASDIEVPAQQRARLVYDGMIKRGADPATAAAWAANALHESAANPSTGPGDGGASQGLFMWNGPRLQAYQAKYGHGPQGAPLDEQLDFVTHELGGTEAPAAARIAQAGTVTDKAAAISREFLRPKDREGEQQRRAATAQQLFTLWGGAPQQAAAPPGTGGGVATRTGGTNVAGPPGTVPGTIPPPPGAPPGTATPVAAPGTTGTPPAVPGAAPAAPAATPAPGATAPTQQPPAAPAGITPPLPVGSDGLNEPQRRAIRQLETIRPRNRAEFDALQQKIATTEQTYRDHNDTVQRQYQTDVQQAQQHAQTQANAAATQAREQERLRIAQEEAEAKPDRVLARYADKITNDTATHEERQLYSLAAQHYLKPTMTWGDDPTDPSRKVMVQVPGQMPSGFPHPDFKPGQQPAQPPTATKAPDVKPLPEAERKVLLDTAGRLDQVSEQVNTFKPDYAGFTNAAVGDIANMAARNLPASKVAVDRANWWSDYQRYKLAVRQGISGQSLTASEMSEFDKADINPGMTPDVIRRNLEHQASVLRTSHERRVASLAADKYSPDAIRAASGLDPAKVTSRPVGAPDASQPQKNPLPPGWTVKIP